MLPYVAYAVLGTNGVVGLTVVSPTFVIANALVELSKKRFDWQVNNCVPEIAVKGVILGVNVDE